MGGTADVGCSACDDAERSTERACARHSPLERHALAHRHPLGRDNRVHLVVGVVGCAQHLQGAVGRGAGWVGAGMRTAGTALPEVAVRVKRAPPPLPPRTTVAWDGRTQGTLQPQPQQLWEQRRASPCRSSSRRAS